MNTHEMAGYDKRPPLCKRCCHFKGPKKHRKCGLYGFGVSSGGVCDSWTGINGDYLEPINPPNTTHKQPEFP